MPVAGESSRGSRSILLPVMGGIVALAWLSFWWLDRAGLGWLFHGHGSVAHGHAAHASSLGWAAFLAGWLLMTVAMMLPTTYPLATLFRRMVTGRPRSAALVGLLLAGYVGAWLGFGVIALAAMRSFEWLTSGWPAVTTHTWLWGAALFLVAGAFQFSPLKYACLDKCRSPFGFIAGNWRGSNPVRESLRLGWRHGVFCVGCCWALMLLMFAVGSASLTWMLALAMIMAVEKNAPWGRKAGRPVGAVLIAVGVVIVVRNLTV